ncbi:MAG: hypothetical protein R2706_18380 [Acidimicrobiales bacterium]
MLVTVMSEGEITVPRLGRIVAAPTFRLVAAMNPFDAVGTARISGALYDRVCASQRQLPRRQRRGVDRRHPHRRFFDLDYVANVVEGRALTQNTAMSGSVLRSAVPSTCAETVGRPCRAYAGHEPTTTMSGSMRRKPHCLAASDFTTRPACARKAIVEELWRRVMSRRPADEVSPESTQEPAGKV